MSVLRQLYDQALDVPASERAAWLTTHCPDASLRSQLEGMLGSDSTGAHPFDRAAAERIAALESEREPEAGDWVGRSVGVFRLRRLIGQGGMAAVFLGEREGADFEQQVAVKLLKRGLFSAIEQRLFRRERQALAALSHPNIARLVDGGVTEECVPYLAMEYVDGTPLTRYASEHGLNVRERLRLLLTVCRAVDAAHRALIVHRDIKPSNILVEADGTPKLLDFGIAKLLDDDDEQTHTGFGALTPEYAAPEQFTGGTITTATDVYALGVLLHELLVGERPEGTPPTRPSSRVVEVAAGHWSLPTPQLAMRSALRGDLDNVILKALEADPLRRYASAGALADDLERHLEGRPVSAYPPSTWYRTRKFAQRHRGGVAITAVMLLGILASLALALWQARIAREQAARAQTAAAVAESVQDFLLGIFDAAEPAGPRDERPSLDRMMDLAEQRLDSEFTETPDVQLEVALKLVEIRLDLGQTERAQSLAERTAKVAERIHGADSLETGNARYLVGEAMYERGERDEGLARMEQAHAMIARRAPNGYDDGVSAFDLGYALANHQRFDEGRPLIEHAIAVLEPICKDGLAAACRQAVMAENNLAAAYYAARRLEDALRHAQRAATAVPAAYGPNHRMTGTTLGNLAVMEEAQAQLADAETHIRAAIAINEKTEADTSPVIAYQRNTLARIFRARGMYLKAVEESERVVAIGLRTLAPESVELATLRENLAGILIEVGDLERAAEMNDAARSRFEANDAPGRPNVARVVELDARIALAAGRPIEALKHASVAVDMRRAQQPPPPIDLAIALITRAKALLALGRYGEAITEVEAALAQLQAPAYARNPLQVTLRARRVEALVGLGRTDAARAELAEAESLLEPGRSADQLLVSRVRLSPAAEMPGLLERTLAELRPRAGDRAPLVRELELLRKP